MTPTACVPSEMDIKHDLDDLVNQLRDLVFKEKKCISFNYLSDHFNIHVDESKKVLAQFIESEKKKGENELCINYLLSGNSNEDDNPDEIKTEMFRVIEESQVETERQESFKNTFFKEVYSVACDEDAKVALSFLTAKPKSPSSSKLKMEDIERMQSLTYIRNPAIKLRNVISRRQAPPPPVYIEKEKEKVSSQSSSQAKSASKGKGKGKKQKKVNSMFSKSIPKPKVEYLGDKLDEDEKSNDPFGSESEHEDGGDETTSKKVSVKKEENNSDLEMIEHDETPSIENSKASGKRQISNRHSSEREEDGDEEEIMPKRKKGKVEEKKNKKKFKRIRQISDSEDEVEEEEEEEEKKEVKTKGNKQKRKQIEEDDDEEEDEEDPMPARRKKPVEQKPKYVLEQVKETYIDEDGFEVTKMVKKERLVEVKEEEKGGGNKVLKDETKLSVVKENGIEKKCALKKNDGVSEVNGKKTKKHVDEKEKDETTKPAPKAKSKAAKASTQEDGKKQTSIMNFFKRV